MKVKFLAMAFTLASFFSYSQEVKVKKGEIQVNGKSVAKIEKEKDIYTKTKEGLVQVLDDYSVQCKK